MSLETNLPGRLRNISLPHASGLLPLFEAVVNSIHAIEEAGLESDAGQIRIQVMRAPEQLTLNGRDSKRAGRVAASDIVGFKVSDNGIGFDATNIKAFKTLDTDHKASKGCRGIGRLMWLKAFERAKVESRFIESDGTLHRRSFDFDEKLGVHHETSEKAPDGESRGTTIILDGFRAPYRAKSAKMADIISRSIFEHCLWYFVRKGSAPRIVLEDASEAFDLNELYERYMPTAAVAETVEVKGVSFELTHIRLRSVGDAENAIAYCADNRLVTEEKLAGKIPGLHGKLSDEKGEFVYLCYVTSELLNKSARPERTGFNIANEYGELLADSNVGFNEIRAEITERAKTHLAEHLKEIKERARNRVQTYVANVAPRYRPIVAKATDDDLNIDPDISDKDLELHLHTKLADFERGLIKSGHEIMVPKPQELAKDYKQRLADYLSKAHEMKMSDLAGYVSHRRVIIDLLAKALERDSSGRYSREDIIHELIMPMKKTSDDIHPDELNLWLIDERLAFHNYLASDKPLSSAPITTTNSTKEPDLLGLNVFDQPILVSERKDMPLGSIVVVEIKRPMRDDATAGEEKDPVEQALGYLQRVREGGVKTAQGRPISNAENVPGYCYILCDLTTTMLNRFINHHDMTRSHDGLSCFTYKKNLRAYVEVISFDELVNSAKRRNQAFFAKLNLPSN